MPRKHPYAVALGRRGGRSRSAAKLRAIRVNGLQTRFVSTYRLTPEGDLDRLTDGHWTRLHEPYDAAAKRWLWRRRTGR